MVYVFGRENEISEKSKGSPKYYERYKGLKFENSNLPQFLCEPFDFSPVLLLLPKTYITQLSREPPLPFSYQNSKHTSIQTFARR